MKLVARLLTRSRTPAIDLPLARDSVTPHRVRHSLAG